MTNKQTVISWIGNIPNEWKTKRLKYTSNSRVSNVDKKSNDENAVKLCNYVDVYKNDYITKEIDFMEATATKDQINNFLIKEGDVIITKDSELSNDIGVPAYVNIKNNTDIVCGYHLAIFSPNQDILLGKYLFRLFQSKAYQAYFETSCNGVTRFGLSTYPIYNVQILLPPLKTQKNIANYLDDKTAKIKKLIDDKKKMIELLKEQKQAIIHKAVTKGIEKNVQMKDSGIAWIGEIPEAWGVRKVKTIFEELIVKNNPEEPLLVSSQKFGVIYKKEYEKLTGNKTTVALVNLETLKLVDIGNFIISLRSFQGGIEIAYKKGIISPAYVVFNELIDVEKDFFKHLFKSVMFIQDLNTLNSGIRDGQSISFNSFKEKIIPLPPLQDQKSIVAHIEKEFEKINTAIVKIEEEIELIEEYEKSLVYHAVTGKITKLI